MNIQSSRCGLGGNEINFNFVYNLIPFWQAVTILFWQSTTWHRHGTTVRRGVVVSICDAYSPIPTFEQRGFCRFAQAITGTEHKDNSNDISPNKIICSLQIKMLSNIPSLERHFRYQLHIKYKLQKQVNRTVTYGNFYLNYQMCLHKQVNFRWGGGGGCVLC